MERPAKERLIGAVVIVTVAWLLIPVFLDEGGGDGDAVVSRELALPDSDAAGGATLRRETVALGEPEDATSRVSSPEVAPVTALPLPEADTTVAREDSPAEESTAEEAAAPPETGPEAEPVVTTPTSRDPSPVETVVSVPEQAPETPPQPVAATDDGQLWAVQVGSFSNRENAQRLASELRGRGLLAFLSQIESGGNTLHRVRVGPQASRDEAAEVAAALKASGQGTPAVVPYP
ncbi:MAG: SPOR domain-containing protein [Pseudomonadota bacterium]